MKELVLFVIVTLALGKEISDDIIESWVDLAKPYLSDCAKKCHLSESEADSIIKTLTISNYGHKRYVLCINVSLGLFDAETKSFNINQLVKKIKGLTREIAEDCFTKYKDEEDNCNVVFASGMCFLEKLTEDR